jgi:hypothetical protein
VPTRDREDVGHGASELRKRKSDCVTAVDQPPGRLAELVVMDMGYVQGQPGQLRRAADNVTSVDCPRLTSGRGLRAWPRGPNRTGSQQRLPRLFSFFAEPIKFELVRQPILRYLPLMQQR